MMLLREVFSIVLLFAPAEADTGHPPGGDEHATSSNVNHAVRAGPAYFSGETINAGGYALNLFAPHNCTRLTLRPDMRLSSAIWRFHPAVEAVQNRNLFPLIKDALRLVTDYIGSAASNGHEIPMRIMVIGIRG
jgi:hypothetical protein